MASATDKPEGPKQANVPVSLDDLKARAEGGDVVAMVELAECYTTGEGVQRDDEQAAIWYRRAAKEGWSLASVKLGDAYASGAGVSQDDGEAVEWYHRAALQDSQDAMLRLAVCYYGGRGVQQSDADALEWCRRSMNDEVLAIPMLGDLGGDQEILARRLAGAHRLYSPEQEEERSLDEYQRDADAGDHLAMAMMGVFYASGRGVVQDYTQAAQWYGRAASAGSLECMWLLALCYTTGRGVPLDPDHATEWHVRAKGVQVVLSSSVYTARKTSPLHLSYALGSYGPYASTWTEALGYIRKQQAEAVRTASKALFESEEADVPRGLCHEDGFGTEQDLAKAVEAYTTAAEQDDAHAMFLLGACYEHGRGTARDAAKAATWYEQSSIRNHAGATYCLGNCHERGQGVARDATKAAECYRRAAEASHVHAMVQLGRCFFAGQGVALDAVLAVEWYERAATLGSTAAMVRLGGCYELGRGARNDPEKAAKWYRRAAFAGNMDAMVCLGSCYEHGRGVMCSLSRAIGWYRQAAEAGHAMGMGLWAHCHEQGLGVSQNLTRALELYHKAASSDPDTVFFFSGIERVSQRLSDERAIKSESVPATTASTDHNRVVSSDFINDSLTTRMSLAMANADIRLLNAQERIRWVEGRLHWTNEWRQTSTKVMRRLAKHLKVATKSLDEARERWCEDSQSDLVSHAGTDHQSEQVARALSKRRLEVHVRERKSTVSLASLRKESLISLGGPIGGTLAGTFSTSVRPEEPTERKMKLAEKESLTLHSHRV